MIEYIDGYAFVDGYKFKRDLKTGYYLSSNKIGKSRKRLHVYIWEKYNGTIPKGYQVHHIDKDKDNNNIDNLRLLEKKEHMLLHGRTMSEERKKELRRILNIKARPLAGEWHKSDEGRAWHSKHAKEQSEKTEPKKYICDYCGNLFETKKAYKAGTNKFCSNKCKSAFRRKSGSDNVIKICEGCGKEFYANKYQKTKYCESCKRERGYPRGRIQYDR